MNNQTTLKHDHDFSSDTQQQEKRVTYVFWLTTLMMVVEIFAGTYLGSMALLADGWHMGTHSAAFALTLFAYHYAKKHAKNPKYSFGVGKVSFLGGFASAIALGVVALIMIVESILRLIEPQSIQYNEAIAVAIVGLSVNIISAFLLGHNHHHDHDHDHEHEHEHEHHHHIDHNLRAAYLHVLADALTSVLAIIALIAGKWFGWVWMDAVMGIVGAIVILKWAYGLIQETSGPLLDENCSNKELEKISTILKNNYEVEITDFHLWKISPRHRAGIIGLASSEPKAIDEYKNCLLNNGVNISHLSMEVTQLGET